MQPFATGAASNPGTATPIMKLPAGLQDPLYRFGPFLADPVVGRLFHDSQEVPLTPKSFSVLVVLLSIERSLVSKEELFQRIWPDTFVEPNNLARNISMIRKALHERDADQEYIVTISGRGYRFVAPVSQVSRGDLAQRGRARRQWMASAAAADSLPGRPRSGKRERVACDDSVRRAGGARSCIAAGVCRVPWRCRSAPHGAAGSAGRPGAGTASLEADVGRTFRE